jgi:hypothetical protein
VYRDSFLHTSLAEALGDPSSRALAFLLARWRRPQILDGVADGRVVVQIAVQPAQRVEITDRVHGVCHLKMPLQAHLLPRASRAILLPNVVQDRLDPVLDRLPLDASSPGDGRHAERLDRPDQSSRSSSIRRSFSASSSDCSGVRSICRRCTACI